MEFSFVILSEGRDQDRIQSIINSIDSNNIPTDKYEIIIVGDCNLAGPNITIIPDPKGVKPGWITRAKNLGTKAAKFDRIVYLHSYIALSPDWYQGFLAFGDDWDVCMNPMLTRTGARYRDYAWMGTGDEGGSWYWKSYHEPAGTKWHISGAYWVAKKVFMEKFPLDENLYWGEAEDIVWSDQIRNTVNYRCNANSIVFLMKDKFTHCRWK